MTAAAVILAAGASSRLGYPKQLVMFEGERLLERTVRIAREAGCFPIIVVLGANRNQIESECDLTGTVVLNNDQWQEGMASSLRLGISAVLSAASAVVMTCDMPAVTAVHLRALISTGELTASRYADRSGVPAFFPADAFPILLASTGDAGARQLLRDARTLSLEYGELDVDTPEDVRLLSMSFDRLSTLG